MSLSDERKDIVDELLALSHCRPLGERAAMEIVQLRDTVRGLQECVDYWKDQYFEERQRW